MLPAVEFNNQPPLQANEVNNIRTKRYLTPKLEAAKTPIAKLAPNEPLGLRHPAT